MFRITGKDNLVREVEAISPVDDLAVGIGGFLSTEWGPSDQAFEHNSANRPPIAEISVALAVENLRRNVVGSTDSGVCHCTTRFTPSVDLTTVRDSQVDRFIEEPRVAIFVLGVGGIFEQLLIVGIVMLLLHTSGQAEIRKFDMTTTIQENIIGFDITICEGS